MEKFDLTWKIFGMYLLIIFLLLISNSSYGQIQISVFNAGWNAANKVDWVFDLTDIETASYVDVSKDIELQKKHKNEKNTL